MRLHTAHRHAARVRRRVVLEQAFACHKQRSLKARTPKAVKKLTRVSGYTRRWEAKMKRAYSNLYQLTSRYRWEHRFDSTPRPGH